MILAAPGRSGSGAEEPQRHTQMHDDELALGRLAAGLFCSRVAGKQQLSGTESRELQRFMYLRLPSVAAVSKRLRAMIGTCDQQFRRDTCMEEQVHRALNIFLAAKGSEERAHATILNGGVDVARDTVAKTFLALSSLKHNENTRDVHELVKIEAESRFCRCREFKSAVRHLHGQVVTHRQARTGTQLCLGFLGDDLLGEVVKHLPYRSAPALMASCKEFSQFAPLVRVMPHLSVRPIVGVVDGCVVKGRILALYTDLVVDGEQGCECHELQCKRFSMVPDLRSLVMDPRNRHAKGVRLHRDSDPQPGRYRRRVGHDLFFSTPLVCSTELVDADTLEPVGEPLQDCPWVELSGANRTYTCPEMNPYPARASFRVTVLSRNRRFRIKVSGTARPHGSERTKTLYAYSEPFFARSRLSRRVSSKTAPGRPALRQSGRQ